VPIFFRQFERGHAILTLVILLSSITSGQERKFKSQHNLKARNASPSVEEVRFAKLRPDLQTGNSLAAQRAYSEAIKLRAEWKAESFRKAIRKYLEAQSYWQTGNDTQQEARALKDAADVYGHLSEYRKAIDYYGQSLRLARNADDPQLEIEILNGISSAYIEMANTEEALRYCNRACDLSQQTGNRQGEACSLNNLGLIHFILSDMMKAMDCFDRALVINQDTQARQPMAETYLNLGYAQGNIGNVQQALSFYCKAHDLSQAVNDRRVQALALTAMGGIYTWLGEKQKSLNLHDQALQLFQAMGNQNGEAATLNGIGYAYDDLGDKSKALDCYTRALRLYQAVGNRNYAAITMGYIGRIYFLKGDKKKALDCYNQKLSISRVAMDRQMEAYTLKDMGAVFESLGDNQKALKHYEQAFALNRSVLDRRAQAYTLNNIGSIYASSGNKAKAVDQYKQALELIRAAMDRRGEVSILYNLARAERDLNRFNESRIDIESSLEVIETLRSKVAGPQMRASYLASVYQNYEFYIDLLMRMHKQDPSKRFNVLALEINDHSRARTLLEALAESRVGIRQGVDIDLLEKEHLLQQKLNEKAEQQMRMLSGKYTVERIEIAQKEVETLLFQYHEAQAKVRDKSPRYAALTQPIKLSLQEIQESLDSDTLLLEYALGDELSYGWAVTRTSVKSFELPSRSDIEETALNLYNLLISGNKLRDETDKQRQARILRSEALYPEVACKLSRMLFGPVADSLKNKQLVIVADGALQYVPFNALPEPGLEKPNDDNWQPLIVNHQIVRLPSLSTLTALRKEIKGRGPAEKSVAIFADPVFDKTDPRVTSARASGLKTAVEEAPETAQAPSWLRDLNQSARESGESNKTIHFNRLPFSYQEASAITTLAPPETSLQAVGFDANRTKATSAELSQYRIVHFATHGLLNDAHPELSGIVLSLIDKQGNRQDGFLRLNEIYNLNLPVELVVLSACQTGLGKDIRGEGLIGLTRGFMYAGAARVVASLWKINDRAAAELMSHFYKAMLGPQQLTPAAALRVAQIKMWETRRWRFPYFWAAFILQGEWK
jgi:CHAT domain-containing protein/Flp pilus assembly protein TadD